MNDAGPRALVVRPEAERRTEIWPTIMGQAPEIVTPMGFAVGHINASAAVPISEHDLVAATAAESTPTRWRHHVSAFLDETDLETRSDLVRAGALTYAQLARAADRHLPAGHPTRQWLDGRA